MKSRTGKILNFLGLFSTIFILLIAPDIWFCSFSNSFAIAKDITSYAFVLAISAVFLINKNRKFAFALAISFTIVQCAQFCYVKHFGTLISPSSIFLMTREVSDVFEEATYVFWDYICLLLAITLSFLGVYKISCSRLARRFKCKFVYTFFVFLFAVVFPLLYFGEYSPNGVKLSLENSLRALVGYIDIVAKNQTFRSYQPYTVKKVKNVDGCMTIVYILGESANYDHMSLFGYGEDTTPELKKLAQSPTFYYTRGIAGAVTTISSSKFMMNAIREPDNVKETSLDTTNLFRLAKESGFKTFYISAKVSAMLASVGGVPYIDVLITKDQYLTQFSRKRDSFLLELLREQEFAEKNFVVIHQRCIHSPYKKTVPKSFVAPKKFVSSKNDIINDYDNAMLYDDSVISGFFNVFNKFPGKVYIFFASDHNELMGDAGLWGHGILDAKTAQIPVMIQSNDEGFLSSIKKVFAITHYDICCAIADLLGFEIKNPNEVDKNVYYIDGVDYLGRCGYIKFRKDRKNKKVEYFID